MSVQITAPTRSITISMDATEQATKSYSDTYLPTISSNPATSMDRFVRQVPSPLDQKHVGREGS